jgi:hypothetical protein
MPTDVTGWLLASNGTSVHFPFPETKDAPWPTAVCGRRGLSRVRTTKRAQDGKPLSPCRNCERIKKDRGL